VRARVRRASGRPGRGFSVARSGAGFAKVASFQSDAPPRRRGPRRGPGAGKSKRALFTFAVP